MGKRYYCDYCDKTMVAAPSIVKTHNKGLPHQKLVLSHYHQFKDPETIVAEESAKKPCTRLSRGDCSFGSMCRFSHFTIEELNHLRQLVSYRKQCDAEVNQPSFEDLYQKLQQEKLSNTQTEDNRTILYDEYGVTHVFPWTYNTIFNSYGDNLPPSLRRLNTKDFENADINTWGR